MVFMFWVGGADSALGFNYPNLATAMTFQDGSIPVQELPLLILGSRSTRIILGGLRLFILLGVFFMNGLVPRLVPIGTMFL